MKYHIGSAKKLHSGIGSGFQFATAYSPASLFVLQSVIASEMLSAMRFHSVIELNVVTA